MRTWSTIADAKESWQDLSLTDCQFYSWSSSSSWQLVKYVTSWDCESIQQISELQVWKRGQASMKAGSGQILRLSFGVVNALLQCFGIMGYMGPLAGRLFRILFLLQTVPAVRYVNNVYNLINPWQSSRMYCCNCQLTTTAADRGVLMLLVLLASVIIWEPRNI